MRKLMVIMSVLLVAGCASRFPEPIRTDNKQLVEFPQALQSPDRYQGETARWGGVIASIDNRDQQTRLEVVNFRLNSYGRPITDDQTPGRFVVYLDRFVDPEVYKPGRAVTALGTFSEVEEGAIGDYVYVFPVLQASGVELWQERQPQSSQIQFGYYDPMSVWYRQSIYGVGPYRYHPYYYPYRVRGPLFLHQQEQRQPQQKQPATRSRQHIEQPRDDMRQEH
jgi:outer membrane lipoprotein